jgi:hypothetical protein
MVAELAAHAAAVAVPVGVGMGTGVAVWLGTGLVVDVAGAGVSVSCGVTGMRKHPLRRSAVLLATTANSASGTSRVDMPQS